MRLILFALVLALLGCGSAEREPAATAEVTLQIDAGATDAHARGDAGITAVQRDAGSDAAAADGGGTSVAVAAGQSKPHHDLQDGGPSAIAACPLPDGVVAGGADEPLSLETPSEPPIGAPFTLAVSTSSGAPLSTAVRVCANGVPLASLQLYRGRGSVALHLPTPGPLLLQARAAHASGARALTVRARPTRRYDSSFEPGVVQHAWTAAQDVVIEGSLLLPAGQTLTVGPGTRILLGTNASLAIAGELRVQGTADAPVLFTRAGEAAWGNLSLRRNAQAWLDHAWFVAGGGDVGHPFGHSSSQPVVWVDSAKLDMRGGGLIDNPGKAFGANKATINLDGTLISRCDTGGQFDRSQLEFRHLHVLEMPDADGKLDDDDNDGFYFDNLTDDAGVEVVVEDSVFAHGEDDAIDQNGAQVRIERVWIEDFQHEGVACSNKREVTIRDSVVRNCGQGIEAGYGAPHVHVERSFITGNGVGVRFGDEYSALPTGTLDVSHSIVAGNTQNVLNLDPQQSGPVPDALHVRCSVVDDAQLAGSAGNVLPPAAQPWPTDSCSDAALLNVQQCQSSAAGPACL